VQRFGVGRVGFLGDREVIRIAQISDLKEAGFHYITAITKPQNRGITQHRSLPVVDV